MLIHMFPGPPRPRLPTIPPIAQRAPGIVHCHSFPASPLTRPPHASAPSRPAPPRSLPPAVIPLPRSCFPRSRTGRSQAPSPLHSSRVVDLDAVQLQACTTAEPTMPKATRMTRMSSAFCAVHATVSIWQSKPLARSPSAHHAHHTASISTARLVHPHRHAAAAPCDSTHQCAAGRTPCLPAFLPLFSRAAAVPPSASALVRFPVASVGPAGVSSMPLALPSVSRSLPSRSVPGTRCAAAASSVGSIRISSAASGLFRSISDLNMLMTPRISSIAAPLVAAAFFASSAAAAFASAALVEASTCAFTSVRSCCISCACCRSR